MRKDYNQRRAIEPSFSFCARETFEALIYEKRILKYIYK
jgi:hypothetical protein